MSLFPSGSIKDVLEIENCWKFLVYCCFIFVIKYIISKKFFIIRKNQIYLRKKSFSLVMDLGS